MALHPKVEKVLRLKEAVIGAWAGLSIRLQLNKVSSVQRNEMFKAFVYGFAAAFDLLVTISNHCEVDQAQRYLTNINTEIDKLFKRIEESEPKITDGSEN